MPRLIDANPLHTAIVMYMAENAYLNDSALDVLKMLTKWMEEAPTIDAEPVRHGRWGAAEIIGYDGYHAVYAYPCSECGKYTQEYKPNYCPTCGAKMDAKGN